MTTTPQGDTMAMADGMLFHLKREGVIDPVDFHFSRFMGDLAETNDPDLILGIALASHAAGGGDVCLELEKWAGKSIIERVDGGDGIVCPSLSTWRRKLAESKVVGPPDTFHPLILDNRDRLYLYRYWTYESELVAALKKRKGHLRGGLEISRLKESLDRFFPTSLEEEPNRQRLAAAVAAMRLFCVISGGPGTGKTYTAGKILGVLSELAIPKETLKILLAAPTGKAAARLADAIKRLKPKLTCSIAVKASIPEEAQTLHRLLKPIPGTPYFRHDSDNPVEADLIVIDEASMVDIALMAKLMNAVKKTTGIILMGDKDQLASVESGAVLGDLCNRNQPHSYSAEFAAQVEGLLENSWNAAGKGDVAPPGLQDHIVFLEKSYRFPPESAISRFSRAVNSGDSKGALSIAEDRAHGSVSWKTVPNAMELRRSLQTAAISAFRDWPLGGDPIKALDRLDRFRILCAVKRGVFGVAEVNRMIEDILFKKGLIDRKGAAGGTGEEFWYIGRPILITRNDYRTDLFNGDMGIALADHDATEGGISVCFHGSGGDVRRIAPHRLPEHETAFAMTVHKSQGSEFEKVILMLPNADVPVLSRELIYTAVTRARENVTIWGVEEVFFRAVKRTIRRSSGLKSALWGAE